MRDGFTRRQAVKGFYYGGIMARSYVRTMLILGAAWSVSTTAAAQAIEAPALPSPLPASNVGPASSNNPQLLALASSTPLVDAAEVRRFATGQRTPFCQTANGWLGGIYVYRAPGQAARAYCVANDGTTSVGVSAPARIWRRPASPFSLLGWNANQIEPRGAAILFAQSNGRDMRACVVDDKVGTNDAKTVLGYVGDDGRCYGVALNGFSTSGTTVSYTGERKGYDHFSLVMRSTAADANLPQEGWLSVKGARLPRGVFESYGGNIGCRGKQGNDTWAGYVNTTTKQCDLFTYYNGQTRRASVADYEVYRLVRCRVNANQNGTLATADNLCTYATSSGPRTTSTYTAYATASGPRAPWAQVAGQKYWLCYGNLGTNQATGASTSFYGFTSRQNGCTNGTHSVTVGVRPPPGMAVQIHEAPADDRG